MVSLFKSCISKTCCNKAKIVSNINLSFKKVQIWSPSSCFEWLFLKLTIVQRMWTPGEAFVEMIKGVTQTTFGQLDYYFHWFRRSSILLLFFCCACQSLILERIHWFCMAESYHDILTLRMTITLYFNRSLPVEYKY